MFEIVLALIALFAGYLLARGPVGISSVAARSVTMPARPHIRYLAPARVQRGIVNEAVMQSKDVIFSRDWQALQSVALEHPLDALLIDAASFETMSETDQAWLQGQFRGGVVIVAFGLEDEELASELGLKTLREPGESDIPIGPTGYRMIYSLILGQHEDINTALAHNWIEQAISGEAPPLPGIQSPMRTSFGKA